MEAKTDPWQSPDGGATVCHAFPVSAGQLISPSLIPTLSGTPLPPPFRWPGVTAREYRWIALHSNDEHIRLILRLLKPFSYFIF